MKIKFILFSFLLQFSLIGFGQDKSFDLLEDQTETNILYDRVIPISKADQLKTENTSMIYFRQLYSEIQRADFQNRLPGVEILKQRGNQGIADGIIPLSILVSDFENIRPSAFNTGEITKNSNGYFVLNSLADEVFEKHQISAMGTLLKRADSFNPLFVLNENMIFNTSDRNISTIEVFDNSQWKQIYTDTPFQIHFNQSGNQSVKYKITFDDGISVIQSFGITVRNLNKSSSSTGATQFAPDEIHTISSTIPFQGYGESQSHNGQGEYEIYYDTTDGILDRPVILIDGFDPGDTRGIESMYSMLNYGTSGENLADIIRAEGYDVVMLNFPVYARSNGDIVDGGADYIQRNAMILVELINQLNQNKEGDYQNVIIGPSMGGLIGRYALRYMEMNGMDHDTRLYISFDSPHLGANVPIGFQHLFNYMAYGPFADESVQMIVDGMLRSPAAKEMLIDHFEAHLQNGSQTEFDDNLTLPAGSPGYRDMFQNELNVMGFPQETRNVAIINGAGNGTSNGQPGQTVIDHIFNITSLQRAIIKLNFTPVAGQTIEVSNFKGQQWIIFWVTIYESLAKAQSPSYTSGLDSSPGGRFDLVGLAESAPDNDIIDEFLDNLEIEYFSFIPAVSAMAITATQNLYDPVESGLDTPFVNFYIPDENQNHVYLEDGNVLFALTEILIDEGEMGVSDELIASIQIENPVRESLKIFNTEEFNNVSLKITDMSGRTVFSQRNLKLSGQTEIPLKLSTGSYILQIDNGKEKVVKRILKIQ